MFHLVYLILLIIHDLSVMPVVLIEGKTGVIDAANEIEKRG